MHLPLKMAASLTSTNTNVAAYESEEFADVLEHLGSLDVFSDDCVSVKRSVCERCRRPATVCLCPFFPSEKIEIKTTLYILQHPSEESRCLRTVPILENSLPTDKCYVLRGKRFSHSKFPDLSHVFQAPNTILLYPGSDAIDIQDLPQDQDYNLVILDGTWAQAKGIYTQNQSIKNLKKVQIKVEEKSRYVIRTQPNDSSLSTLETAAIAISTLEQRPEIAQTLVQPLVALCDFQIQHGACEHQSREFRVENGLWTKPLPRAIQKRLDQKKVEFRT